MTVIDAKVLEERRRLMQENSRRMKARWDSAEADHAKKFVTMMTAPGVEDEDYDFGGPLPDRVPYPEQVEQEPKQPRSSVLRWFRSHGGPEAAHSFKLSYPFGLSEGAQERVINGLLALDWVQRWEAWTYMGAAMEEDAYRHLETLLKLEVSDVFHLGDPPPMLAQHLLLHWDDRTSEGYVTCLVRDIDDLPDTRMMQFGWIADTFDGLLTGSEVTFPQNHSGDIVAAFKMAGFIVSQTFSSIEPHYVTISEGGPMRVSGMLDHEEWLFLTEGDYWELRLGGADPALWPRWCYGGRRGDTSISAASMTFQEAELLIADAIQRYRGGHPEKPLKGAR